MDTKGGGLTHYDLGNNQYLRQVYGEGLRVPKLQNNAWDKQKYFYQKPSFCRGYIWHHRSNSTQQWMFHFMFGGVEGFVFKRVIVDFGMKYWGRMLWVPVTVHTIGAFIGQREYDANAYDYFYFSD